MTQQILILAVIAVSFLGLIGWRLRVGLHGAREPSPGTGNADATNPARPGHAGGAALVPLRVARIFQETPTVRTFRLVDPNSPRLGFSFQAGQYLNLRLSIDGREVRRTYTIASAPSQTAHVELTIRRDPQGLASCYLHDRVQENDVILTAGAAGRFTFDDAASDSIVLIAGGVGITPLMSIARELLNRVWPGDIYLIDCVGASNDIIFREELEYLQRRNPNFHLKVLVTGEAAPDWTGETGAITAERIASMVPEIASRRVHLCGPAPMMAAVQAMLAELGTPSDQVFIELFSAPPEPDDPDAAVGLTDSLVHFQRSGTTLPVPAGEALLDAALAGGVDIEYSCRQGICGTCRVKLLSGDVAMAQSGALLASEVAEGYILACQAKPTSAELVVEA